MAAPFVPLSIYPDFRLAMLHWIDITEHPIQIWYPAINRGSRSQPPGPPEMREYSLEVCISGGDSDEFKKFRCGNRSPAAQQEIDDLAEQLEYLSGVGRGASLSPRGRVAFACIGYAFDLMVRAAYEWEKEQKANGYDVDALEELGEYMVGPINRLARLFNIQQQYQGVTSPPCWSPLWDEYIANRRYLTPLERFTGTLYNHVSRVLTNLRQGDPEGETFSETLAKLYSYFLSAGRAGAELEKAVKQDVESQTSAYWEGVRAFARRRQAAAASREERLNEQRIAQGLPPQATRQRRRFPSKFERELKVALPEMVEIEDFSKSRRRPGEDG